MRINKVRLNSYRNYDKCDIQLSPNLNVLYGANAQGKTNFAEALYLSAVGKSPRINADKDLIKWGQMGSYIRVECESDYSNNTVEIYLTKTENKRISINGLPISKIGDLLGVIKVIYFSPDEMKIVKAAPSERRRFLDVDISQLSKNYFYNLKRYNKILSQRNKLLKSQKATDDTLYVWDKQLADTGQIVISERIKFCELLNKYANITQNYLTDNKETLEVKYEGIKIDETKSIGDNLLNLLTSSHTRDMEQGFTYYGLHKDDIKLTLNGIDVRAFGSQGQQRTVALALKLAELEIFTKEMDDAPVLILDDVLSELDEVRQSKLLSKLEGVQTIITCTEFDKDIPCTKYKVTNGNIQKV